MVNRATSALLIIAMLLTLWTPITDAAAVSITISNLNNVSPTVAPNVDAPSSTDTVDTFTTNPVSITANIAGIPDSQVQGIYMRITNTTTLKVTEDKTIKPTQVGSEITFNNVLLSQGLNKIELKHDAFGYTSVPGWANFSAAMSISDLKLNDQQILDNGVVSRSGTLEAITGTAINADAITMYLNGTAYYPASFSRNRFTFYFNTGRISDMVLEPGNNELTFVSTQGNHTYSLTRRFLYDNGRSFPYDVMIDQLGFSEPNPDPEPTRKNPSLHIIDRPTIETNTVNDVDLRLKLKSTVTGTVYDQYDYADLYIMGSASKYTVRYSFWDNTFTNLGSANGGQLNNGGNANKTFYSVTPDALNMFAVHDMSIQLPIATGSANQIFEIQYTDIDNRLPTIKRQFFFDFVDKDQPYIYSDVQLYVDGSKTVALNKPNGFTQITRFPARLKVMTDNSQAVMVRINGQLYNDQDTSTPNTGGVYPVTILNPVPTTHTGEADIVLQGLPDGGATLEVIPCADTDCTSPQYASIKTYNLQIASAPLLLLDNVYNGMVITGKDRLRCGSTQICMSGRIINKASATMEATLNGQPIVLTFDPTDPEKFRVEGAAFNIPDPTDPSGTRGILDRDGKKQLSFKVKVNNQEVTFNYEFYIIADTGPTITHFDLDYNVSDPRFVKNATGYITTATQINLLGRVLNGATTHNATVDVTVQLPGKSTETNITSVITQINPANGDPSYDQVRVTDYTFPSDTYGEFIFNLRVKAQSGSEIRQQIRVKREPQPYRIIDPLLINNTSGFEDLILIKNSDGKTQLNINKNYMTLMIYAERATKVLVGKEEAMEQKAHPGLFRFDVMDLKNGKNEIKFTVVRGDNQQAGSIVLNNTNVAMDGLQHKKKMGSSFKVFDGEINLSFPKDTKLIRYDRNEKFITAERSLLFAIASTVDGRVEKTETPAFKDFLNETTGRFRPASKRYWIDAGTIENIPDSHPDKEVLYTQALTKGGGRLPTEPSDIVSSVGQFQNRDINYLVVPSKPGELTLKYDPVIRNDAWRYLTVFQYNVFDNLNGSLTPSRPNGEWRNIGGVIDTKNNTITVPVDSFGYFQVMYMDNGFGDLDTATNKHWAKQYIEALYSKGIMRSKDTEPNRFLPDEFITRGEFVQMIVNIFDLPLENRDTRVDSGDRTYNGMFIDVPRGSDLRSGFGLYDFKHIEAAARAGIIRGQAGNLFGHDQSLTRAQAALIIARAANLKMLTDYKKASDSLQKQFTDGITMTDPEFVPAIEAVAKAKLMDGIPNDLLEGQNKQTVRFDPNSNITRAQAATIAYRVLQQQNKFPK
ncbi:S-layer homology domain-containing protein [Paenibacillus sp. YYML68]|uniref:S-layer homology domain-containing protein n=1 Tax=Paenibacillus sp. YYML68 TaxID=2909250 RepID=UPI00248FA484|nr:S-layer homology domain-containing protein [Paenibacillus sp. YYML68]